jgi:hypothetical protein
MVSDSTAHVAPIVLWQCACSGHNLPKRDYLHIMACSDCQSLGEQIHDALSDIEKVLGRRHRQVGPS